MAGVGGGLTLIALLAGFSPLAPKEVIGLTAPVLLIGNGQRAWLFREHTARRVSFWFLIGGIPAAAGAALVLPVLPTRGIEVGIALLLLAFVAERVLRGGSPPAFSVAPRGFVGVGAVSGALSATVGGSGPFSAPFFHGAGLVKERFVATNAVCNGTVHAIKTAGFMVAGVLTASLLPPAAVAAATVMAGNWLGERVLGRISERAFMVLLLTALTVVALRLLLG